jgi:hypothetical protein
MIIILCSKASSGGRVAKALNLGVKGCRAEVPVSPFHLKTVKKPDFQSNFTVGFYFETFKRYCK